MKARLDVVFADLQTFSGLGSTQSFNFPQHEDRSVVAREGVDGSLKQQLDFAVESLAFRVACVGFHVNTLLLQFGNAVRILIVETTQTRVSLIDGDLRQPCRKLRTTFKLR